MKGDEVIEKGIVLVEGNFIKVVGIKVCVLKFVIVIDCKGKIIMFGFVDVYGYFGDFCYGFSLQ